MLTLTGVIRAVTLGGGVNKKTGEVIPLDLSSRSRAWTTAASSSCSPSRAGHQAFEGKVGEQVTVPVRALGSWRTVSLA
jgi:hypothetical protein